MEVHGAAHHRKCDQSAKRLQAAKGRVNTDQQQRGGDQFSGPDRVLTEQPGLREQSVCAKTRGPVIQFSENGLCFRRIGELEPQAVQENQRGNSSRLI